MAKESNFQSRLVDKLEKMFPGSYVMVNDGRRIQGFPDVSIFHDSGRWATLECKRSSNEPFQPNQEYYIEDMGKKGYSAVIFPENEKEILDELQRTFGSKG